MRLNRFISQGGHCSRRRADDLIRTGQVRVNGQVVTELGSQVDPAVDEVRAEGRLVQSAARQVVLLLNKPKGVLCTASDPHGRRTVLDLVQLDLRVVPVGRLDGDSSGALLLTNDGDLMHRLLHPSGHVPKEYILLTDRELTAEELQRLTAGVRLDGRRTKPCELERIGRPGSRPRYRMVLTEGRNRQIRRMMADQGVTVERLHRRSIAGLTVEGLEPGEWRVLLRKEIDQLRRLCRPLVDGEEKSLPPGSTPAPGVGQVRKRVPGSRQAGFKTTKARKPSRNSHHG
jgi:pseudouridine synthase